MSPVELLRQLISTPSFSRSEDATAALLFDAFAGMGFGPRRFRNNVWAVSEGFDASRLTLMLNSHHDTVRPSDAYTRNPFEPVTEGDRLYGLGSNDAGASVVALTETFRRMRGAALPFNLMLAITAEEEVTGENGMRAFLPHARELGYGPDMAVVGEPTGMQPAIGERGLLVLDCTSRGVTGHAARNEGVNAIYKAMADIERLRAFTFPRQSELLGPVGLQVTQIQAGRQHNVVPDECRWVVDVRTTDAYSNEETAAMLQQAIESEAVPRSFRVRASALEVSHPLVQAAVALGKTPFVSPTTSDMSQLSHPGQAGQLSHCPAVKMGPGQSSRSHSADEFVLTSEIESAINDYISYLNNLSDLLRQ